MSEMSDGLLRQRRNLFISSVILWFMKFGGVTISKASFSGLDFSVTNDFAIYTACWIAFTYFLFRYYQYFAEEGTAQLGKALAAELERYCNPTIQNFVKSLRPDEKDTNFRPGYSHVKQRGWQYHGQTVHLDERGGQHLKNFSIDIPRKILIKDELLAYLEIALRKRVVTDYILPFVVAFAVLAYCGEGSWKGSFVHLIFQ